MSQYINISKEQILELREQGLKMPEIAKRFGCSRDKLNRVLRGERQAPLYTSICPICGNEYTHKGKTPHATCGSPECKRKHRQIKDRERHLKAAPDGKIRPYTETSNIMIVQDLEKGWSAKQIAEMYGRDVYDVQRHIDKIIQDGTASRIKRMLSTYQKNNTLKRRSGLL